MTQREAELTAQLAKMTKRVDELGGFDKDANACERATLESSKEELYSWTMFYMKKVTDLNQQLAQVTQKYHEAMDIMSTWNNIDHSDAVAQLLEAKKQLADLRKELESCKNSGVK